MAGLAKALSQLIISLQLIIMNCKIVCKNFKNWLSVTIDHLQQNFTIHDWFAIVKVEVLLLHFSLSLLLQALVIIHMITAFCLFRNLPYLVYWSLCAQYWTLYITKPFTTNTCEKRKKNNKKLKWSSTKNGETKVNV